MVQRVEEEEKEKKTENEEEERNETKTEEDLRKELEAILNFLEMSAEEIQIG